MWNVSVITLFPEIFPGSLEVSVVGNSLNTAWCLKLYNLRNYTTNTRVDDTLYGGGAGMLLRSDVVGRAMEDVKVNIAAPLKIITTSPRGKKLNKEKIEDLTQNHSNIVILCGRFEGIDQRAIDYYNIEEISIGDYVISGGELAAMVIIDACVRTLPGVLGNEESILDESFNHGLLECDQYTKPRIWNGLEVPAVLLSGNHQEINKWRKSQSEEITKKLRPDLFSK
jgi:tRNA (guanine37-N1)-methyltransferase